MKPKFHCIDSENFRFKEEMTCAFTYRDYEIRPHNHDFYEMNIILSGRGVHKIESTSINVCAGDVFVIPPGMVHAYEQCEKLDVFHILLQKKFIDNNKKETSKVNGFLQLMEIEPFIRGNLTKEMFLHLSSVQLMELKKEMEFLEEIYHQKKKELEPLKQHSTWKILFFFSRLIYAQLHGEQKDAATENENTVIRVLEYMHTCYGEKITLEGLCKKFYISRATLIRKFEKICGCSPMVYLLNCRKKVATELIAKGELSKTEIANICGFYDLSHMKKYIEKEG